MKKNYQNPVMNLFAISEDDILTVNGSLAAMYENVNRDTGASASYGDDVVSWGKYAK